MTIQECSMDFKYTWQWIQCWLFGHARESVIVFENDHVKTMSYRCTRCEDAFGITTGDFSMESLVYIEMILSWGMAK